MEGGFCLLCSVSEGYWGLTDIKNKSTRSSTIRIWNWTIYVLNSRDYFYHCLQRNDSRQKLTFGRYNSNKVLDIDSRAEFLISFAVRGLSNNYANVEFVSFKVFVATLYPIFFSSTPSILGSLRQLECWTSSSFLTLLCYPSSHFGNKKSHRRRDLVRKRVILLLETSELLMLFCRCIDEEKNWAIALSQIWLHMTSKKTRRLTLIFG